jgi:hypothetical protein
MLATPTEYIDQALLVIDSKGISPLAPGRWIPVCETSTECQGVATLEGTGLDQ